MPEKINSHICLPVVITGKVGSIQSRRFPAFNDAGLIRPPTTMLISRQNT